MKNNTLENLSFIFVKLAKFFVKLAIFFVVIYLIGVRLFDFGYRLFYEKAMTDGEGQEVIFEIKNGDTVDDIAENLKSAGLIDDPFVFKFRSKIYKTNFTPNVYNLRTSMTIKNMLDIFDEQEQEYIVSTTESFDVYQLSPEEDEVVEETE